MLKTKRVRKNGKQSGQGMTEYIIIVGLIAIFLIAAVKAFGTTLNSVWTKSEEKIQSEVIKDGIDR
jgi:Flp pilus assembly pilin Flp